MVNWVVQNGGTAADNPDALLDALYELKIPYKTVGLIPFTEQIVGIEDVDPNDQNIFYGSTKLVKLVDKINRAARDFTFRPGVFYDPTTFTVDGWNRNRHVDELLNYSPIISTIGMHLKGWPDLLKLSGKYEAFFIRPLADLKEFAGRVVYYDEAQRWFEETRDSCNTFNDRTLVAIFPVISIAFEWRFFIVNHKVVAGSQYKAYNRLKVTADVPPEAFRAAEKLAKGWLPHPVCVMDLALPSWDEQFRIIEFNCFNASGFYAADVKAVVSEVTKYVVGRGQ